VRWVGCGSVVRGERRHCASCPEIGVGCLSSGEGLIGCSHGGPTDLANLALLCRTHHRAVHQGGWRLTRQPDGRLTATHPTNPTERHPAAA
jgi:hypothetical protein